MFKILRRWHEVVLQEKSVIWVGLFFAPLTLYCIISGLSQQYLNALYLPKYLCSPTVLVEQFIERITQFWIFLWVVCSPPQFLYIGSVWSGSSLIYLGTRWSKRSFWISLRYQYMVVRWYLVYFILGICAKLYLTSYSPVLTLFQALLMRVLLSAKCSHKVSMVCFPIITLKCRVCIWY